MTSINILFTHTSDEIFEKYTISEIKSMQNELQKEINKKKDELRVLVGEKYRDFIEVIDKISIMNELANNITNRIDNIASALSTLNSNMQSSSSLKSNDKQERENHAKNTIGILIRLLMNIEDQVWYEINENKFIIATTLLQLAVHIKTVLNLETSWKIDKNFFVVNELWNSILRFPVILTQLLEEKLKSSNLSSTVACECLCSLTVLENIDSIEIIRRFLTLRIETLKTALNVESISKNVRTRVIISFQIIINTFEILYDCFKNLPDKKGDYWIQMESITTPLCEPAINLVNLDNKTKFGKIYLPAAVMNFKIKTMKHVSPLSPSKYNECISEWLSWVKSHTTHQIRRLLNLTVSLKSIHLLKDSVQTLPETWTDIMVHFNQKPNLNLWKELYEPLIIERAKALLLQQWNRVFDNILVEINVLIKEIIENKKKEPENDLHWFLWESLEDDICQRTTEANSMNIKGISIKSLGISPNSGKICFFVELQVSNMINELANVNTNRNFENKESLILTHHQQLCCIELVEKLINHVQVMVNSENAPESVIMFLARFLFGITRLCSSLKECILLLDDKGEKWLNLNKQLQEESLNIWRKWSSLVSSRVITEFSSVLALSSLPAFRIKHFPKWDIIKIKEEMEGNNQIEAEMRIPFQASFFIQNFLNSLTSLISQTLPPRIITIETVDIILSGVLQLISDVDNDITCQFIDIQFLFDIKYLSALLIPIENNKLTVESHNAITKIQNKIDPVDLDAISSYLSQNIKQFVFKTQSLYGILINNKPRITVDQYVDNSDDPNVTYCGATNIPWFPLLPVSAIFPSNERK